MNNLNKGVEGVSFYAQLVAHYRDDILSGVLPVGSRLPTELELARQHQISRGTVRHALNILVNEGLLERTPGRGTYVRQWPLPSKIEPKPALKWIGLLLSQPVFQISLDILLGVEQTARARGYELSLTYTEESQVQQDRDIERLRGNDVTGIILLPLSNPVPGEQLKKLQRDNLPLVLVDRYIPELDTDYVVSDNIGGAYRATEHLIILGHHRIGFAYSNAANFQTTSVRDRWQGYRKALEHYNLGYDESLVFPDLPLPLSGVPNEYDRLILRADRPKAFFAVNDSVALGLLQAAQRNELPIPEELALVGFDDLSFAPYLTPPLTTVSQPRMEIGIRAANLLINRIEGQTGPYQHIELPTNLLVRASCGVRLHLGQAVFQSERFSTGLV
jgi:GntR family transcriptional regulator, arabinose operon transcriptional repressor